MRETEILRGLEKARAKHFAHGTPFVHGKRGKDKVPAMLTHGEAVLPAKTVRTLGAGNIARMIADTNNGKAPKRGLYAGGRFADGLVDKKPTQPESLPFGTLAPAQPVAAPEAPGALGRTLNSAGDALRGGIEKVKSWMPGSDATGGADARTAQAERMYRPNSTYGNPNNWTTTGAGDAPAAKPAGGVEFTTSPGASPQPKSFVAEAVSRMPGQGVPDAVTGAVKTGTKWLGRLATPLTIASEVNQVGGTLTDTSRPVNSRLADAGLSLAGRLGPAAVGAGLGAAAGALTGPAAPVASPALGLLGGAAGYFGGAEAVDGIKNLMGVPRSPTLAQKAGWEPGNTPAQTAAAPAQAHSPTTIDNATGKPVDAKPQLLDEAGVRRAEMQKMIDPATGMPRPEMRDKYIESAQRLDELAKSKQPSTLDNAKRTDFERTDFERTLSGDLSQQPQGVQKFSPAMQAFGYTGNEDKWRGGKTLNFAGMTMDQLAAARGLALQNHDGSALQAMAPFIQHASKMEELNVGRGLQRQQMMYAQREKNGEHWEKLLQSAAGDMKDGTSVKGENFNKMQGAFSRAASSLGGDIRDIDPMHFENLVNAYELNERQTPGSGMTAIKTLMGQKPEIVKNFLKNPNVKRDGMFVNAARSGIGLDPSQTINPFEARNGDLADELERQESQQRTLAGGRR